ncbi:Flp family type IVb pilin [Ornithinimicrobium sediminis]|uniref:Flp family type IVb pilin n=1 Tax=Ornithinimicrobium sediminis TaxID=2904603 RepID=UPI001E327385|nr:Flp family type IVb pilin [Ornithinimicrobium sediminis]MCE0488191.1 Flp family type IVb pilin [Ornithinimicrobium sediminis]
MAAIYFYLATLQEKFSEKEKGATAVEYGLLVALIAAAIILTVTALGGSLNALFTAVTGAITGATP